MFTDGSISKINLLLYLRNKPCKAINNMCVLELHAIKLV